MSGRLQAGPRFFASLVLRPLRLIVMAIGAVSILLIAYPVARAFAAFSTKKRIVSDQEGWVADDEEGGDPFQTSLVGVRERAWARRVIGVLALLLFMSIAAPFGLIAPAPVEAAHETVTHIHLVIGSTAADCTDGGTGMTSTTSDPGTLVPLVVCVHNSAHQPVDTAANTVLWFSFGVAGSTINSTENQSNVQGIAKAFATSSALGTQFVFACYDHSSDGACSGGNDFSSGVTVNWIDPDLHLAFTPTDPPSGSDHDCSAGPVVTSTVVGTPIEFVACAHNQTGTALSDARVTPTVASGSGPITPAWASTTASGRATFTVTPTTTGDLVITATAVYKHTSLIFSSNTVTATVTTPPGSLDHLHLAFSPPNGDAHSCSAGPTTSDTDVDTPREFVACAQDESHNPAPGAVVTPTLDSGVATTFSPPTATTDGSGRTTFTMSATETGQSVVTATASKDTATVVAANLITNTWTAGSPATITLEPPAATNVVGSPHLLTATATDSFGNPVSDGTVVTFTVVGEGATVGTSNVNGGEGRATFSFTSTQAGSSTITATTQGSTQTTTSNAANKTWHHGPPATVTVVPPSDTNTVGDTHTVTATATDEFGNPIANHGSTLTVTGAGGQIQTGSTDGGGVVVFSFTSTQPGTSQITVTVWSDGGDASGSEGSASGTATKDWLVGLPAQVTSEPPAATNIVGSPHVLTATANDSFGNPVSDGTVVTFTVVGEGATVGVSNVDGGEGRATFSFTSTQAGSSTITATTQGSTQTITSDPANKTWHHGAPATVTVVPSIETNTVGDTHTVTATATDEFDNPIANHGATLTVSGEGDQVQTASTDDDGVVVFSFTSTQPGTSQITVTVWSDGGDVSGSEGSASGTATKDWLVGLPAQITLEPEQASNLSGETHTVTATVTDEFGNVVADGTNVTFTVIGRGATSGTDTTTGGEAQFSFVSTQPGISTITATSQGETQTLVSNQAIKFWTVPPAIIDLVPPTATNAAGSSHTVTATVTDSFGNPFADDTIVTFTVVGEGATVGASTLSGGQGKAAFSFTSTQVGSSTITATVQGATQTSTSNSVNKTWHHAAPDQVVVTPSNATNTVGDTHTVTATATDEFGNPIANHDATLTVAGTGDQVQTGNTDANGVVVFTFTSTQAGESQITVTVWIDGSDVSGSEGSASGTATKHWTSGMSANITLEPLNATNTVGDPHTLTATVTDEFGNTVADGTVVTFTVVGEGSNVGTSNVNGGEGRATFSFTSTQAGSSTITATTQGATQTITSNSANKTWHHGPPQTVTVIPSSQTNTVGDTHTVTATATDEFGNPIAGHGATLTVSGTGDQVQTGSTDAGGVVVFSFTSTQPGTSQITVTVWSDGGDASGSEGSASGTATKDWTVGLPAQITLEPEQASNLSGETHTVTATVTDEFGNVVADGTNVTFTVIGRGATSGTDTTTGAEAQFSFVSTQPGISTITATSQGETQTLVSNQAIKFWTVPPAIIDLVPPTATNAAGSSHTVTATVTDSFGNPFADDTIVTFTVVGEGATVGASTLSGGQGKAAFSFTSTQVGSSTITATVQGATQTSTSNSVNKTWHHAAPDQVVVTPSNATNTVGETHTVTGTATDQFGNPIANHGATLTVTGAGAQTKTGNTDAGGVVVFTFTSTQPGASQVTITVWSNGSDASGEGAGSAFGTASKQWSAGGGANITLDPPTATNAAGDTHTVTAMVEDDFGNPIADGAVVTFTVTGLGATVGTSAVSGGQGEATFGFSSTQTGSSTITATVQGETQTLTSNQATKDWHHAAPAAISFSPSDPTEFEGNTLTVVATATDQFGNAISNHDVDFVKSGKPGTVPASDTTDVSGVVTFAVYSTTTGIQVLTMTVSSDGSDASGAGAGAVSAANVITWVGKRFTPLPPLRILDTRADNETGNPIGTCTPACATIPPNSSIEVEITGHGGVPLTGVGAAKLNATIVGPTAPGFLTLYPKGQAQPVVSNLNFVPGDVRANLATVKVGTGGRIIAFNGSTGPLDVVFDIAGWYGDGTQATQGGSFVSVNPDRLLDTRDNTGGTSGPIPPDGSVTLTVLGAGGVPAFGVTAVVLNATVDDTKSSGFLTIYPAGQARPLASNINFTAGRIVPNLTAVKVGSGGQVVFFNGSPNTIEIVADVFGYFTAPSSTVGGGSIEPLDPSRILDTRGPLGSCSPSACAAIGPGQTMDVQVAGLGGVPPGAEAVVLNATVDQPTARGFLTIFPSGQGVPLISNLNFEPGQTVPNLVMIRLGQSGKVTIYNGTSGTVHVILDVGGWFRPTLT